MPTKGTILPYALTVREFFRWQKPSWMLLVLGLLLFRAYVSFEGFLEPESWCHCCSCCDGRHSNLSLIERISDASQDFVFKQSQLVSASVPCTCCHLSPASWCILMCCCPRKRNSGWACGLCALEIRKNPAMTGRALLSVHPNWCCGGRAT